MISGIGSNAIGHVGAGVWGSFPSLHGLLRARAPRPQSRSSIASRMPRCHPMRPRRGAAYRAPSAPVAWGPWHRGIRHATGFTLVEILITTSLMSLVAGAIIAALTSGVRLWQRTTVSGLSAQAALIAFDQFNKDLRSYRRFSMVPFEGTYDGFTVPAVHQFPRDPAMPEELGGLTYYLDGRNHRLCRAFVPYRLSRRVGSREQCETVLDHVGRFRLEYFGALHSGDPADWSGSWDSKAPPVAVKASVTLQESGRQPVSRSWLVSLARPTTAKASP